MSDMQTKCPDVRFTLEDAQKAYDEWSCNCGPGAIAAISGLTLDELRPYLGDFERKGYCNPSLMWAILENLKRARHLQWWERTSDRTCAWDLRDSLWPAYGLARVQWEGPWTAPGVPIKARYRHTHWVGSARTDAGLMIFDINCMCVGGWVPAEEWANEVVPWLLKECEPKANGLWHLTHVVKVGRL